MFSYGRASCIHAPIEIVDLALANIGWYVLIDLYFQSLTHSTYIVNVTLAKKGFVNKDYVILRASKLNSEVGYSWMKINIATAIAIFVLIFF